jgi:membrane-associated protein
VAMAAILGDQVGYVFGRRVGPAIFRRPDSRLFKQAHVEKASKYFEEHGPKTILLARFVPIVRTFAPIVAGVGRMEYRTFVTYNVMGGLLWGVGITTLGFLLGEAVDIDKYLLPVIAVIVLISVIPVLLEIRKAKREGAEPAAVPEAGSVER